MTNYKHETKGVIISARDYDKLPYSEKRKYFTTYREPTHKFSDGEESGIDLLDIVTGVAVISSLFDNDSSSSFDSSSDSSSPFDGGGGGDFGGGGAGGDW